MNKDRHVHFAKSQSNEILRFAASIEQIHSERGHSSQTFVATRNHLVQRIFTVRVQSDIYNGCFKCFLMQFSVTCM